MNSFKLFQLAKKLSFCIHSCPISSFRRVLSFYPSVTLLCNSKKSSTGQKMTSR